MAKSKSKEVTKVDSKEIDEKPDDELVAKTCKKITKIFSSHIQNAVIEVGEYLIKEFFDGDFDKARKKKKEENSIDNASLNKVFENFKRNGSENSSNNSSKNPSKTWLYGAINYVVQEHDIKEELPEETFQTSGKLSLSHKIELLKADFLAKEDLINKAVKEKLTVREFRKEVAKTKKNQDRGIDVLTIIKKPELLLEESKQNIFTLDAFKKKSAKQLDKILDKIGTQQSTLKEKSKEFEKNITDYKKYIEMFDTLKKDAALALKDKQSKSKK